MKTTNRFRAGGNAANDEAHMNIKQYLERQCALHGIRRGDIPRLLGYTNRSKALRRFDRFVAWNWFDESFAKRIRTCPQLAGDDLDLIRAELAQKERVDRKEQVRAETLRRRYNFVPHIWFEHERELPRPLFIVAQHGEEPFRRFDLPEGFTEDHPAALILFEIPTLLMKILSEQQDCIQLHGPFGKAVSAIYRDTYDHGYVFDLTTLECIGERHEAPRVFMLIPAPTPRKLKTISMAQVVRRERRARRKRT